MPYQTIDRTGPGLKILLSILHYQFKFFFLIFVPACIWKFDLDFLQDFLKIFKKVKMSHLLYSYFFKTFNYFGFRRIFFFRVYAMNAGKTIGKKKSSIIFVLFWIIYVNNWFSENIYQIRFCKNLTKFF